MRINSISNTMPMAVRNNKRNNSNQNFGMKIELTNSLKNYLMKTSSNPLETLEMINSYKNFKSEFYRGLKVVMDRPFLIGILGNDNWFKVTCMIDKKDGIAKIFNFKKYLTPRSEHIVSLDNVDSFEQCAYGCANELLSNSFRNPNADINDYKTLLSAINPRYNPYPLY